MEFGFFGIKKVELLEYQEEKVYVLEEIEEIGRDEGGR